MKSNNSLKLERREQKIEGFKPSKNMPRTGVTKASLKHVKLPVQRSWKKDPSEKMIFFKKSRRKRNKCQWVT